MVENDTTSIRFDTLDKLSNLLDVPIGELFIQTDETPEKEPADP